MQSTFIRKIKVNNVGPFIDEQEITFAPFTLIFGKNSAGKSYLLRTVKAVTCPFKTLKQFYEFDRISPNNLNSDKPMEVEWKIPMEGASNKELKFSLSMNHPNENIKKSEKKYPIEDGGYKKIVKIEEIQRLDDFIDRVKITFPADRDNIIESVTVFVEENRISVSFKSSKIQERLSIINPDWYMIFSNIRVSVQSDFVMFHTINVKNALLDAMIINSEKRSTEEVNIIEELGQNIIDAVRCVNNSIDRLNEQFQYINASRLQPKPIYDFSEFIDAYPRLWDMIESKGELLLNDDKNNSFTLRELSFSIKEMLMLRLSGNTEDRNKSEYYTKLIKKLESKVEEVKTTVEQSSKSKAEKEDLENGVFHKEDPISVDGDVETKEFTTDDLLDSVYRSDWYSVIYFMLTKLGYPEYDVVFDFLEVENEEKKVKISIRKTNDKTKHPLDTIGYGISQILPVLFGVALKKGRLIIEEPEIHLHPSAQLNLIRLLVELDKENIRLFHYVFETHSEVMIRGLQAEIAKNKEENYNNKFSIIYLKQDEDGKSKLKQIRIKQDGFLEDKWPEDYFNINHDLASDLWYHEENLNDSV